MRRSEPLKTSFKYIYILYMYNTFCEIDMGAYEYRLSHCILLRVGIVMGRNKK